MLRISCSGHSSIAGEVGGLIALSRFLDTHPPGRMAWVEIVEGPAPRDDEERMPHGATARFDASLAEHRRRGGSLACLTDGPAADGALHAALAADLHVMTGRASLLIPGAASARPPFPSTIGLIVRRAGAGKASALLLSPDEGTTLDAASAENCGLGDASLADREAGCALAARIDAASPRALRLAREMISSSAPGRGLAASQSVLLERASFALAFSTTDPAEGIAAFFAGRPPSFATTHSAPAGGPGPTPTGSR